MQGACSRRYYSLSSGATHPVIAEGAERSSIVSHTSGLNIPCLLHLLLAAGSLPGAVAGDCFNASIVVPDQRGRGQGRRHVVLAQRIEPTRKH